MAPLNILIVGNSIAGPALTCFLLSAPPAQRPRITLLERASSLRPHGQNIDIRGVGVPLLRKLGIEAVVRAGTTGEKGVQWVTGDNKPWAEFGASSDADGHSPTSDIEIMRGRLGEILHRRSRALSDRAARDGGPAVEYVFGEQLSELTQLGGGVRVRFARSGEERTFDVVVGADGLHSATRKLAFGRAAEAERVRPLGMYAAFFSLPAGKTDTEFRRSFHTVGRRVMMLRPSGREGRTTALCTIFNETDKRFGEVVGPGKAAEQKELVREYFEGAGWESGRIMKGMMETEDFYYEMVAQVKMERWSKGRVALLGDSG
jgi:2-polyprenyl-6-methoxyphenol hydroxylase-like FAD-dependent oxidoreductase